MPSTPVLKFISYAFNLGWTLGICPLACVSKPDLVFQMNLSKSRRIHQFWLLYVTIYCFSMCVNSYSVLTRTNRINLTLVVFQFGMIVCFMAYILHWIVYNHSGLQVCQFLNCICRENCYSTVKPKPELNSFPVFSVFTILVSSVTFCFHAVQVPVATLLYPSLNSGFPSQWIPVLDGKFSAVCQIFKALMNTMAYINVAYVGATTTSMQLLTLHELKSRLLGLL